MSSTPRATHTFVIPALDCPEEYALIDKGLGQLPGVQGTAPDYLGRALRVEFDPTAVDVPAIEGQLKQIGFPSQPRAASDSRAFVDSLTVTPVRWTTVLSGGLLALAGVLYALRLPELWLVSLLIASTAISSWHVARAALRALRLRAIDMNVLMTIAAVGAVATGEYFEAATAMFLFAVSLWLEGHTLSRARQAVRSLVQLTPATAHRLCSHGQHVAQLDVACGHADHQHVIDIHPREIQIADLLLVRPGERIPVDGVVAAGASAVNEAPITGESIPVDKQIRDPLFAGSLNGEGTLELRATRTADESTLAHVARLVEQAQAARSPTERFVDKFARYYTPAVVALALLIAFAPPLLATLGLEWLATIPAGEWLHRGLVLLVIACPCALVISTPVTIICGLHQATRYGLLVKGGEFLERAAKLRCIAFDKTGTLTEGRPELIEVRALAGGDSNQVLRIAAALEAASEHPLAAAIVAAARQQGWPASRAQGVTTVRGAGVEGQVDGADCFVGSVGYAMKVAGIAELPTELRQGCDGLTAAVVGRDRQLLGAIYLADKPRGDARLSISELRRLNVESVVMLTGDSRATADRIGTSLGVDHIHAELLPQEKVRVVQKLVDEFDSVAMVGDGVNDAPALAASRLGIALGMQASDTALETADVVSLSPHLGRVPQLIRLGRRTRDILSQNIAFALSIKLGVLLLAAVGLGTLWAAVIADVGASMLVVFNGMRLLQAVEVPIRMTTDQRKALIPVIEDHKTVRPY